MTVSLLSSAVSAGQPTAAAHYNNLRKDALYLSNDESTAVTFADLLEHYENNFNLVALSTNRVRVEASPTSPVDLVVSGRSVRSIANVDLATGYAPSGAASLYYVFAEASGTSFSLNVSTSPTEWTGARRMGSFYWDGSQIVPNSITTELRSYLVDLLLYAPPQTCQGRLTLTSDTPVTTSDVSGSTIYFTQYHGSTVDLYAPGFGWVPYVFDELTISAAAKAANLNIDVFIYHTGSALALELVDWSTDTARATSLEYIDGIPVKYGENHKRYLGTIRTSAAGVVSDTEVFRGVWNLYNPVPKKIYLQNATVHTYSGSLQFWNADSNMFVTVVTGLDTLLSLSLWSKSRANTTSYLCSVRIYDGTSGTKIAEMGNNDSTYHINTANADPVQFGANTYSVKESGAGGTASGFSEMNLQGLFLG